MGCGCNEQHNSNCFCQCENLDVPQGPTGLQGIQGATGAAGAAGAAGADGADAFNAQLSSYAVAINLADTTGAFAGVPPVAYKYYNNTITTVFSLTEGGVPVAIDVANMALTYGGEVNLATIANVAGGIELTLVRGLNTPTSNYGYVDMTYTHGALTFVKRFNVVYVQDGVDFQVGIDDTSYITDPQEGMELLTKSGQMMRYQGGAWIQTFDIHQTATKAVVLTGASYTLNLTATDERIISLTGSGIVNNNITINLPVAGCTSGTEFKVLYDANMTAGTGYIKIFDNYIPYEWYNQQLTISAYFNGTAWSTVITTSLSQGIRIAKTTITPTQLAALNVSDVILSFNILGLTHRAIFPISCTVLAPVSSTPYVLTDILQLYYTYGDSDGGYEIDIFPVTGFSNSSTASETTAITKSRLATWSNGDWKQLSIKSKTGSAITGGDATLEVYIVYFAL